MSSCFSSFWATLVIKMSKSHKLVNVYMKLRSKLAYAALGIVPLKEVEDIVQETYVRACQVNASDSIRQPEAYLFRIARNLALDHAKRTETQQAISDSDVSEEIISEKNQSDDPTVDKVIADIQFSHLCDAVRHLPLQQKRAFVLKKVYGYTQKEIAEQMQLSVKTVERHIALGMERCKVYMMRREKSTCDKKPSNIVQQEQEVSCTGDES